MEILYTLDQENKTAFVEKEEYLIKSELVGIKETKILAKPKQIKRLQYLKADFF